jgi:hypothetical protein
VISSTELSELKLTLPSRRWIERELDSEKS